MSARELLHEIQQLPPSEQRWLLETLQTLTAETAEQPDEADWSTFSAGQLLAQYAPEDSVYDKD